MPGYRREVIWVLSDGLGLHLKRREQKLKKSNVTGGSARKYQKKKSNSLEHMPSCKTPTCQDIEEKCYGS